MNNTNDDDVKLPSSTAASKNRGEGEDEKLPSPTPRHSDGGGTEEERGTPQTPTDDADAAPRRGEEEHPTPPPPSYDPSGIASRQQRHHETRIAEPPRWRFVNSAKKSMGYSSVSAGLFVQGLTAEELVSRRSGRRVALAAMKDRQQQSPHAREEEARNKHERLRELRERNQRMQDERARLRAEKLERLRDLRERTQRRRRDERARRRLLAERRVEAERRRMKERVMQLEVAAEEEERSRRRKRKKKKEGSPRAVGEDEAAGVASSADDAIGGASASVPFPIVALPATPEEVATARCGGETKRKRQVSEEKMHGGPAGDASGHADPSGPVFAPSTNPESAPATRGGGDSNGDEAITAGDDKRRSRETRGISALIAILLCVVAALLGVMLSGNESDGDGKRDGPSGLRGPSLEGTTSEPTASPVPPPSARETETRSPVPTIPPTASISPTEGTAGTTMATAAAGGLVCPPDSKGFELAFEPGRDPSMISWVLSDRCSSETLYLCEGCHQTSPPGSPAAFAACLPTMRDDYGDDDGAGNDATGREGREYALRVTVDVGSGEEEGRAGFGYVLRYDGEVVVRVEEGGGNFTSPRIDRFGEGNGCSEAPSGAPEPTQYPSEQPFDFSPLPSITPSSGRKPGCTPFIDDSPSCARKPRMEFELLISRNVSTTENGMFGSSVTFFSRDGGQTPIVAVMSGGNDPAVHMYQKREESYLNDVSPWEYLTSIRITTADTSNALFESSLASNEEGYIVVGTPGVVFVYMPNTKFTAWYLVSKLTPGNGDDIPVASFGSNVAFDGTLIAVGSPDERNGKGAVYIFEERENTWNFSIKLSPENVADGAHFGASVSLHGDAPATLAVGAPRDNGGGSAFVYEQSDFAWLPHKLTPRDVEEGDNFGSRVVISGCTVAVSSPNDVTVSTNGAGTVRIFNWDADGNDWVHSQIIEPYDELFGEVFGECIAMEGSTLLVGGSREGGKKAGVVYRFERVGDQWVKILVILNDEDHVARDKDLGCPISLFGNLFVAGAKGDSSLVSSGGSALIYDLCPDIEYTVEWP